MSSHSRTAEREEERRLNMRTVATASAASAAAALVTSQLWIAGTWIAAALTPVIVTLVSELLHRPTERIARGLTADREALRPSAATVHPDPRAPSRPARRAEPARPPGPPGPAGPAGPVRVYRSGASERSGRPPGRRRKVAFGVVFGTAALAFVIAVLVLTVPELIAGGSIGKND